VLICACNSLLTLRDDVSLLCWQWASRQACTACQPGGAPAGCCMMRQQGAVSLHLYQSSCGATILLRGWWVGVSVPHAVQSLACHTEWTPVPTGSATHRARDKCTCWQVYTVVALDALYTITMLQLTAAAIQSAAGVFHLDQPYPTVQISVADLPQVLRMRVCTVQHGLPLMLVRVSHHLRWPQIPAVQWLCVARALLTGTHLTQCVC
jgi:hypothetical protein